MDNQGITIKEERTNPGYQPSITENYQTQLPSPRSACLRDPAGLLTWSPRLCDDVQGQAVDHALPVADGAVLIGHVCRILRRHDLRREGPARGFA